MKLKKFQVVRLYELTFLIPAVYTDSELVDLKKEVEALIKKYKGEVKTQEDWGKKSLAYSIKHASKTYTEAYYFHYQVNFPTDGVQEFEKFLYMNNKIIRHLLVLAEEESVAKTSRQVEDGQEK